MPVFAPGTQKNLKVAVSVNPIGTPFDVYTWIGTATFTATSSPAKSLVSTGFIQSIIFPYTFPSSGSWKVFVLVTIAGNNYLYIGDTSSDVIIPEIVLGIITWE